MLLSAVSNLFHKLDQVLHKREWILERQELYGKLLIDFFQKLNPELLGESVDHLLLYDSISVHFGIPCFLYKRLYLYLQPAGDEVGLHELVDLEVLVAEYGDEYSSADLAALPRSRISIMLYRT